MWIYQIYQDTSMTATEALELVEDTKRDDSDGQSQWWKIPLNAARSDDDGTP